MPRWFPELDVSQAAGSADEMERFGKQRLARLAREGFEELGRGVLILHVDHNRKVLRSEYNTMDTDDGSDTARRVRRLVEAYDPHRQAVLLYRDPEHDRDAVGIVDIEAQH